MIGGEKILASREGAAEGGWGEGIFARPSVQFGARSAPSVPLKKGSDFVKQTHQNQAVITSCGPLSFIPAEVILINSDFNQSSRVFLAPQ